MYIEVFFSWGSFSPKSELFLYSDFQVTAVWNLFPLGWETQLSKQKLRVCKYKFLCVYSASGDIIWVL